MLCIRCSAQTCLRKSRSGWLSFVSTQRQRQPEHCSYLPAIADVLSAELCNLRLNPMSTSMREPPTSHHLYRCSSMRWLPPRCMCGDEGSAVNDHVDDLHLAHARFVLNTMNRGC